MGEEYTSLTGAWMGRYDYDIGAPSVSFEAQMAEEDGHLSGDMTEPNTFRDDMGAHLAARLFGSRMGNDVSFRKTYDGFDQGDDPVYEGQLNVAMTRIDGIWRFPSDPGMRGRFMMVRAVVCRARTEQSAEIPF